MILRCPQGICYATYRIGGKRDDAKADAASLKARAHHGTHMWPLWAAVTRLTVSPSAPVRLVQYIGRHLGGNAK